MEFLVAEEGTPQSIGCEEATIAYYGSEIEFHYETVPPRGTVEKGTWDPITSMLINIHTGKYASLDHWYNNISVKEKEIELKNDYDGRSMILKDVDGLKWV